MVNGFNSEVPLVCDYLPVRVVFRKTVVSIMTKLTNQNHNQRHKYHHLTKTLHLTLKMTTTQMVRTSVTNNSLSKDYPHPDDHTRQTV